MSVRKVFINAQGRYLNWYRAEKGGFVSGSHWCYVWVDSINEATVDTVIPHGRGDEWEFNISPVKDVIVELPARVRSTRTVTLIGEE